MELNKKMLTPKQASEIYGLNLGTLANMRYRKEGPKFYKVGRKVLYDVSELEAYLKKDKVLTIDSI